jgi:hypothetical protein
MRKITVKETMARMTLASAKKDSDDDDDDEMDDSDARVATTYGSDRGIVDSHQRNQSRHNQ